MDGAEVILYDGACGLCHRLVRFVLARDRTGRFRFAPLQGTVAAEIAARHGRRVANPDSVYLVTDWERREEAVHARSDAILRVLHALGWPWRALAALRAVPPPIRDLAYDLVARFRYTLFGRAAVCRLPARRFLS